MSDERVQLRLALEDRGACKEVAAPLEVGDEIQIRTFDGEGTVTAAVEAVLEGE